MELSYYEIGNFKVLLLCAATDTNGTYYQNFITPKETVILQIKNHHGIRA